MAGVEGTKGRVVGAEIREAGWMMCVYNKGRICNSRDLFPFSSARGIGIPFLWPFAKPETSSNSAAYLLHSSPRILQKKPIRAGKCQRPRGGVDAVICHDCTYLPFPLKCVKCTH